jgi:hypothetical protein
VFAIYGEGFVKPWCKEYLAAGCLDPLFHSPDNFEQFGPFYFSQSCQGQRPHSAGQDVFYRFLPDAYDPVIDFQVLLVPERVPNHAAHHRANTLGTQENHDAPFRQAMPILQENIIPQYPLGKIGIVTDVQFEVHHPGQAIPDAEDLVGLGDYRGQVGVNHVDR